MFRSLRATSLALSLLMLVLLPLTACQNPSEDDEDLDVDDFLEVTINSNPTHAEASTDGRTYRVVRGNNQPDEILPFDWKTRFSISLLLNNNSTKDEVDLDFPVDLLSASVKVEQASGGIVSPPTGGEIEHYDSVTSQVSGSQLTGVGSPLSMAFDVWYDLPSLRKEALVSVTLNFRDDDNKTFSKVVKVTVNP